jgi:hypothetical protein
MNNQHAGLSQALAEQRMTERMEQAAQARLVPGPRRTRRRRRSWLTRGARPLARQPSVAAGRSARRPQRAT